MRISSAILCCAVLAALFAAPAQAQQCSGNPDALGTSRVLEIKPGEIVHVGTMQYSETLPLADHEVVLTFDDGPLPPYSNKVLDILAASCVKATYFIIGRMAKAYPEIVRRMYEAGHTIGTHTQNHPLRIRNLPVDHIRSEIDDGIASVGAALGDPSRLAPFFRIPGLERTATIDDELAARSLVTFSADAVADDWHRRIKPAQIVERAMRRLEAHGKGILLLHDIHAVTVAALPELLKQLKEHGYHIVHVVPAAPYQTAIASASGDGIARGAEIAGGPNWPSAWESPASDQAMLSAPDAKTFGIGYSFGPGVQLAQDDSGDVEWPQPSGGALSSSTAQLAAPGLPDLGVLLDGQRLVGAMFRLSHGGSSAGANDLLRRKGRHAGQPAGNGGHADLWAEVRALTALLIPAH